MKLTVLLWAVLLAISSNELLAQPWSDLTSYTFERTASVRDPGLVFDGWKITSRRVTSFTLDGGTVTYYQGISSGGTNIINQTSFSKMPDDKWRIIIYQFYHNRYASGGMLTNLVSDEVVYYLIPPTEDWLIGTHIRTTDSHKLTDTCSFTLSYDNTNSLSPWVMRHNFSGNKGTFDLTIRVPARGSSVFSPGLKDVKKETGKNYSYAHYDSTDSWIPQDEIPFWKKSGKYLYNH